MAVVWPKSGSVSCFLYQPLSVSFMCRFMPILQGHTHLGNQLPSCRSDSTSYVSAHSKQLCETHCLTAPFTVRETEVQRACSLSYIANNWQILHLNDSKASALSAVNLPPWVRFLSYPMHVFLHKFGARDAEMSPYPQRSVIL